MSMHYSTWWRKYKIVPAAFCPKGKEFFAYKWSVFFPFWVRLCSQSWERDMVIRLIELDSKTKGEIV
jgi:hypothetical protein